MKKTILFKTMLLLCALIVGSSSAWAEEKESTLNFTAKCGGSGTADDGAAWTVTSDGTESNFDNTKGIHYGTGKAAVQYINLSTSDISGTITKIVVNASTANNVTASISVTVGGDAFGGDAQSLSTTATNYTFNGSASGEIIVRVAKPSSANGALYVKSIVVTYSSSDPLDPSVATTVTIDDSGITNTNVFTSTAAGKLSATVKAGENPIEGATVTWTSSNTGVATIDKDGVVTLVAAGTATITASYAGIEDVYKSSSDTYELTVTNSDPNAPGTENNPYTVAQARAAIDAGTGVTGVYATGIVSEIADSNFNTGYISYYISADGTTSSDQLQAYHGKSYNGEKFTSEDDIQVGDVVVIYGNLTKYKSIYEFAADNQLVSLDRPVDSRIETTMTITDPVQEGFVGDILDLPVVTILDPLEVSGLPITWTSSDNNIATIDVENQKINLLKAGKTTITATFEGDETYKGCSANYELTVTAAPFAIQDGVFDFQEASAVGEYYGSGESPTSNGGYYNYDETTWTAGNVTMKVSGKYRLWENNDKYTLRLYKNDDPTSAMKFSVPSGNAITKIVVTGGTSLSCSVGTFENGTWTGIAQEVELAYAASSGSVNLSKIVVTYGDKVTVTLADACTDGNKYYGTYSNSIAFVVPADLTVSAVKVEGGKLAITNYNAGDIVKANTGVLISADAAGDKTLQLSDEEGQEISGNMLKASNVEMTGDNLFYRLTMHNGTEIGFWWGAADGAAFNLAANKAYLAVPKNVEAREGWWFDSETTGIKTVENAASSINGEVYNLAGQRVAQPAKGLYIVNGKKVVVK